MEKFTIKDLGHGIKIYLNDEDRKHRVLFASYFHGDENCFDVLLYYMKIKFEDISVSFIPIVNSYGFRNKTRNNEKNENINCSFNHPKCQKQVSFTKQSNILIRNSALIKKYARDGYASLHVSKKPKHYSHIWMQEAPSQDIIKDMNVYDYNLCYNTFDDYLWHEGIPITACIEFSKNKEGRIDFVNKFLECIKNIQK